MSRPNLIFSPFQLQLVSSISKSSCKPPFIQFASPQEASDSLKYRNIVVTSRNLDAAHYLLKQHASLKQAQSTVQQPVDSFLKHSDSKGIKQRPSSILLPSVPQNSGCTLPKFLRYNEFIDDNLKIPESDSRISNWFISFPCADNLDHQLESNTAQAQSNNNSEDTATFGGVEHKRGPSTARSTSRMLNNEKQENKTAQNLPVIRCSDSVTKLSQNRVELQKVVDHESLADLSSNCDKVLLQVANSKVLSSDLALQTPVLCQSERNVSPFDKSSKVVTKSSRKRYREKRRSGKKN